MTRKLRSADDIERDWNADEDAALAGVNPIELIVMFLEHFDFEGGSADLMQPVPDELLEQLADCFNRYASGTDSLDKAFGGKTGRAKQRLRSKRKAWEVTAMVLMEQMALQRLPHRERRGEPLDQAMAKTASMIGKSFEYVRQQYRATRPPWRVGAKQRAA